jgi:hypothetical protein
MKKFFQVSAAVVVAITFASLLSAGLYTDGNPVGASMTVSMTAMDSAAFALAISDETGTGLAILNNSPTFVDDIQLGQAGADGALKIYSEQGATDYTASINPNAAMTSAANFYLPADEPAAAAFLTMTTGGVIEFSSTSAALLGSISDETGTGVSVFNNSPTFADDVQLGSAGTSGELKIYSEQGETDYTASLLANTAMTSDADFFLPADEPAATYILNMTTGGVIGYDESVYLTAEADTLDDVCERDETTDVVAVYQSGLTVGEAAGTTGVISFVGTTSGTAILTAADEAGSGTSTLPSTTGTLVSTGDTGTVTASMIQAAAADLGAADVDIDLSNTNGSHVTNVTIDGNLTADETRAEPIIGGGNGAWAGIKAITETITVPVGSGLDPVVESSGNLAPANSLILGATARVTTAPGGGATTIDLGVTGSGNLDALVDGMSTVATTTATTPADGDGTQLPLTNAVAATLTVTTDADVTGSEMVVKVTVWYLVFSAQTS